METETKLVQGKLNRMPVTFKVSTDANLPWHY